MSAYLDERRETVLRLSLSGHDRDCALAMLSQSRLKGSPLDDVQVEHLLAIGYRAGVAAGSERAEAKYGPVLEAAKAWAAMDEDDDVGGILLTAALLEAVASLTPTTEEPK